MSENPAAAIGARVREARKRRGLTQHELASASGLSISLISKLEQGAHGGIRLETAHRLAIALRVTTTALMSEPDAPGPAHDDTIAWEPLRHAARGEYDDGEPDEEPTIGGVRDGLHDAVEAFHANRYAELSATLPTLLRDTDALVSLSANGAEARSRQVRSQVRQLAALTLGLAWQFDAADAAIESAISDAASDDATMLAAMDMKCFVLLRRGQLDDGRELATHWADAAEPTRISRAKPDDLAAWGRLLMRLSSAAVRDNRPDDAHEALRLTRSAATAIGRDIVPSACPWQVYGPMTVAMLSAENATIQDRPDVTLRIAAQIAGHDFPVTPHYLRHRLDVAHAFTATGDHAKAVDVIQGLRLSAPQWLAQQRYARDILTKIVTQRRALTEQMRDMVEFMQLPS